MRTGSISSVFKIVFFVITAIIVCVVCGVAIGTTNTGRALVNSSTTQIKNISAKNGNIIEATYDGNTILGSEVVALIEKAIDDKELKSIVVRTLRKSRTDYNYIYNDTANTITAGGTTTIQTSLVQGDYINRDSLFLCDVKKDTNGDIICLYFEQQ